MVKTTLNNFMESHGGAVEIKTPKNDKGVQFTVFDFSDGTSAYWSKNSVKDQAKAGVDLNTVEGSRAFLAAHRGKFVVIDGNVDSDPEGKETHSICLEAFEGVDVTDLI
jgi:hypothetical protein